MLTKLTKKTKSNYTNPNPKTNPNLQLKLTLKLN